MTTNKPLLLSVTERLALLHTATVFACAYSQLGMSLELVIPLLACSGFLLLIFFVSKREKLTGGDNLKVKKNGAVSERVGADEDFVVAITDVRRNNVSGKVEYLLEGAYNTHRWTAWLRYSALRSLIGKAGAKADEKFPEKSSFTQWIRGTDSDIWFVDERRRLLNVFLKEAIPNKQAFENLCQNTQVREALGVPQSVEISTSGGGVKVEEVVKEAIKALDMICDIAKFAKDGGDGWTFHSRQPDGIVCYLKKEGDFTYAMGKGTMDVDKARAMKFILTLEHRKTWDEFFKAQQELESFHTYDPAFTYTPAEDPLKTGRSADWEILGLNVVRTEFASPAKAFVAERDSVTVGTLAKRRSDGALCVGLRSIEHPRAPEGIDGYIRAKVIVAGFLFEDRTDGMPGCVLTTMGLVDPNGSIPQFVINMVAPQRALVIRDINKACLANS